jgi:spore maturation protein B
MKNISYFIILGFILIILLFSIFKKINAYEAFIDGAKQTMKSSLGLLPYILIMYVAVNVFVSSNLLSDLLSFTRIPTKFIIQGVFRPVSSHASLSIFMSIINDYGVDSKETIASAILQGGSDTSVYVLGLYFGYANIKKTRYTYIVALLSDVLCFILCLLLMLFIL